MNLDELTLGEIKQLKCLLNGQKQEECCEVDGGIRIVILQRGWVFVGYFYQKGSECRLEKASVIRQWGTSKGLGELAINGPTDSTKLDPAPTIKFHELTIIATIDCESSKWNKKLI